MALPIDRTILHSELDSALVILTRLRDSVVDQIPGEDTPAGPAALEAFVVEMAKELELVAGKCYNLSSVLSED